MCQVFKNDPARVPLHPWEAPHQAWERVHIDFAGPFKEKMWLIIIDALSKWPVVISMTSTDSNKTVEVLCTLFARYVWSTKNYCDRQWNSIYFLNI